MSCTHDCGCTPEIRDARTDEWVRSGGTVMTKPRAGQSGNWDRERADRLQEDVERMQKDVERLERWKAEATEVMSGLRELGKALGLRPGVQITGPAALAEVERLTAEREWFNDRFPCDGVCVDAPDEACSRHGRNPADLWRIIGEVTAERDAQTKRAERLERWYADALTMLDKSRRWKSIASLTAERDSLAARLALVEALAEAEVARLTAERDAAIERLERVIDQWRKTGRAVISEMNRADKAEAERDALAGLLAEFVDSEPCSLDHHGYCQSHGHLDEGECHMARARAVLAGSDADASDTQPIDQEKQ